MRTLLGKISNAHFGYGGYQAAQFGLTLNFRFERNSGVSFFKGFWAYEKQADSTAHWTEANRSKEVIETVRLLNETLRLAKKYTVADLAGVPVELKCDGNNLESWRVLEEVL